MSTQFIDYYPSSAEELANPKFKCLGVVKFLRNGKDIVLLQFVENSDGKGSFFSSSSIKVHGNWEKAFTIDSNLEKTEMEKILRAGIAGKIKEMQSPKQNIQMQGSVHSTSSADSSDNDCPF